MCATEESQDPPPVFLLSHVVAFLHVRVGSQDGVREQWDVLTLKYNDATNYSNHPNSRFLSGLAGHRLASAGVNRALQQARTCKTKKKKPPFCPTLQEHVLDLFSTRGCCDYLLPRIKHYRVFKGVEWRHDQAMPNDHDLNERDRSPLFDSFSSVCCIRHTLRPRPPVWPFCHPGKQANKVHLCIHSLPSFPAPSIHGPSQTPPFTTKY